MSNSKAQFLVTILFCFITIGRRRMRRKKWKIKRRYVHFWNLLVNVVFAILVKLTAKQLKQKDCGEIVIHVELNRGLLGPSWDKPLTPTPFISSALASLWRTLVTVTEAHFLNIDAKTLTKLKKLTIWWPWAHSPQTAWCLRIGNVNPTTY